MDGDVVKLGQGREELALAEGPFLRSDVEGEERPQQLAASFGGGEEGEPEEVHVPSEDLAGGARKEGLVGKPVGAQDGGDRGAGVGLVGVDRGWVPEAGNIIHVCGDDATDGRAVDATGVEVNKAAE